MTNFAISITSDTVCPWCYIGKKKLDRGIALYKKAHPNTSDTFSVTWQPFYLNPTAPRPGIDKEAYYAKRFGPERAAMMFDRTTQSGKEVGINFSFRGKTGNTRDSHRLIQLGKAKGLDVQNKVVEELFSSYFENEGDITNHEMLLKAAIKAGLDKVEVTQWLDNDKGGPEVDKEVRMAQVRGVSGVPNFVLQGKFEIGGAQEPDSFVKVFERVKEMEGSN